MTFTEKIDWLITITENVFIKTRWHKIRVDRKESFIVMISALKNIAFLILPLSSFYFVDKPMFAGYSSRPITFQVVSKWFRFTQSLKWISFDVV